MNERPRDWSMGIYWAQPCLDDCLPKAIKERLSEAQVDPDHVPGEADFLPILNGESGEMLARIPTPGVLRVARSKFRRLLAEGIDIRVCKLLMRRCHKASNR